MKRADIAMYQAKKTGRNAVRFFDPQMQDLVDQRSELEIALRQALPQGQLQLYYQMQVDHHDNTLGAEVLLRWQHPQRGLVSPAQFIPLAEETGLIVPIGQWVLETACQQLRVWAGVSAREHLKLSVNVSARQFRQPDFCDQVALALQRNGVQAHLLKLELTESLVPDNISETIATMQALRALGVEFSMDDFGTGQSSLSSLKKLPLQQLKIDQSFIRDIATDPDDAIIVQTIIAMATNLGMEVIAEGVETTQQRDFLIDRGCLFFQGYLFGSPVPIADFEQRLDRRDAVAA
jgi:EAL domain-containing protein (putative c-di-GMP-specific phosphodiesterase class I)